MPIQYSTGSPLRQTYPFAGTTRSISSAASRPRSASVRLRAQIEARSNSVAVRTARIVRQTTDSAHDLA
jgi:hypothetical protein